MNAPSRRRAIVRKILLELISAIDASLEQKPKPDTTPSQEKILRVASLAPVPAKVLVKRAGLRANSASRAAITDLVRGGKLLRTPDGYSLPG